MSDIKSVLSLLCQHLNSSINVAVKPEHFRLAKFNSSNEIVNQIFWEALNILSYHAVRDKGIELDLDECDAILTTKLHFAYLQYTVTEFYSLSGNSKNNRPLLLAFAWLLGSHNVLNIVTRFKLSQSVLGRECSQTPSSKRADVEFTIPETISAQINNVLYLNGKVNYNIKEISELITERTKLLSKAHAASVNVSGLPHLSIAELALIKRITTINKGAPSKEDRQYVKELSSIANLLDTYMKWLKKEHVFFEWMVTVIAEHTKSLSNSLEDIDWNEISKFISLLHCMTHEKHETVSFEDKSKNSHGCKVNCVSRLLRVQGSSTEIENWLSEVSTELDKETEDLEKIKGKLSEKLKELLRSIPSCVQVSF